MTILQNKICKDSDGHQQGNKIKKPSYNEYNTKKTIHVQMYNRDRLWETRIPTKTKNDACPIELNIDTRFPIFPV